jgi:hypothetical protein
MSERDTGYARRLVDDLLKVTVDLDAYIGVKADALSEKIIRKVRVTADERVAQAQRETQRFTDLVDELRRQVEPAWKNADALKLDRDEWRQKFLNSDRALTVESRRTDLLRLAYRILAATADRDQEWFDKNGHGFEGQHATVLAAADDPCMDDWTEWVMTSVRGDVEPHFHWCTLAHDHPDSDHRDQYGETYTAEDALRSRQ